MIFKVSDIKMINKMVSYSNEEDERELSDLLQKTQPHFYNDIDFVRTDSRCHEAYRFCVLFCAISLEHAELKSPYEDIIVHDYYLKSTKSLIAQDKYTLDSRSKKLVSNLEKYVLNKYDFDDDDTFWLKITIGAFLILLEKQVYDKINEIEKYFYLL